MAASTAMLVFDGARGCHSPCWAWWMSRRIDLRSPHIDHVLEKWTLPNMQEKRPSPAMQAVLVMRASALTANEAEGRAALCISTQ